MFKLVLGFFLIYVLYKIFRLFRRVTLFMNRQTGSGSAARGEEEYSVKQNGSPKKYRIDQKDIIDAEFEEVKTDPNAN